MSDSLEKDHNEGIVTERPSTVRIVLDETAMTSEMEKDVDSGFVSHSESKSGLSSEVGTLSVENFVDSSNDIAISDQVLSKKQLKKMAKYARITEIRKAKRIQRRQKRKETLKAKIAEGKALTKKYLKTKTMEASSCRFRIAVDCQFLALMTAKEVSHLSKQLMYCYAVNRRRQEPMQEFYSFHTIVSVIKVYFLNIKDSLKERLCKMGYDSWNVNKTDKGIMDVFSKSEIVYLTSDSQNVLQEMNESKVYVIGGLVDHNRLKSLCYNFAVEHGIEHARLPLENHIQMKSRRVLTVNHNDCSILYDGNLFPNHHSRTFR